MDINCSLGSITIQAGTHHGDHCGANGLPVTPNSIIILGRFRAYVHPVRHDNLARYVDCIRHKRERVTLVFEHYETKVPVPLGPGGDPNDLDIEDVAIDLLLGVFHLHKVLRVYHGTISADCVVWDRLHSKAKLSHWGLGITTDNGHLLDGRNLLPKDLRFLSPEQVLSSGLAVCMKSDVWSIALVILKLFIHPSVDLPKNPAILAISRSVDEVFLKLRFNSINKMESKWTDFFRSALQPEMEKRSTIEELIHILRPSSIPDLTQSPLLSLMKPELLSSCCTPSHIREWDCDEVYRLWCIASGSAARSLLIADNYSSTSTGSTTSECESDQFSINQLPNLVLLNSPAISPTSEMLRRATIFIPPTPIRMLDLEPLKKKLDVLSPYTFLPIIFSLETDKSENGIVEQNGCSTIFNNHTDAPPVCTDSQSATNNQPLLIKETDFAYQVERICLFRRLIDGCPFLRPYLIQESRKDIPPVFRARAWAAILNVSWNTILVYDKADKLTPTQTDRQISVDVPRCHQYNDLLASPHGHIKLTRVLKAWLAHNGTPNQPGYVYWQGLDSLAAPFVLLNFHNEALAFASFNAFIHKYLSGFFLKENTHTIQEYLALFSHTIAFHDVRLYNHLMGLGFTPELYAIPWFLTMFTHVLPLDRIVHVWDTLLLGDETFPLCIGMSILAQLRDQLMEFNFNDCILIFSDLPEINIEQLVLNSVRFYEQTPPSALARGVLPLSVLKSDMCPRINLADLTSIISAHKKSAQIMILDARTESERSTNGHIVGALPAEQLIPTNGGIVPNETDSQPALVNGSSDSASSKSVDSQLNYDSITDISIIPPNVGLVIVINSAALATRLVLLNVPRVVLAEVTGHIPNELKC